MMRKRSLLAVLTIVVFAHASSSLIAQDPQLSLKQRRESDDVSIELRIDGLDTIGVGETLAIELVITPKRPGKMIYLQNFQPLLPPWGTLALYDAEKNYLGDLLLRTRGSFQSASKTNWTQLGDEPIVCRGEVRTSCPGELDALPSGTYYLQLTFHAGVIVDRRDDLKTDLHREFAWQRALSDGQQHLTGPRTSAIEFTLIRP